MSNSKTKSTGMHRRDVLKLATVGVGTLAMPNVSFGQAAPIRVGHQQDMTGFLSFYGFAFDKGARAAIKRINAHGGIAGRKVEYILEDTESDVAKGVQKFRKLVESENADFVLGATHSGINLATNPLAKELKTVYFPQGEATPTTSGKGNRYVFRIRPDSAIQGHACVAYGLKNLGQKWSFIVTDYAYGNSFYNELAPLVKAQGGTVIDKIAVPVQTQDMIPYLARVPSDTEVLFSVFTTADGVRYMRQSQEIGLAGRMSRLSPWGIIDGVSLKGLEKATDKAYFLSCSPRWLDQIPGKLHEYVAQARKLIGVGDDGSVKGAADRIIATSYYLASWEAIYLFKQAVEKSGWTSKKDNPKLIEAMEGFEGKASLDFPMGDFLMRAADHQAFQGLWIEQAKSGKLDVVASVPRDKLMFPATVNVTKESF
jgi:branched-chain amino acid transport system substrate-binding protein